MSSKKNSSKAASAKSSSASTKEAVNAQPVVAREVKGVDMGQGKVLADNAGFFRKCYYRYTLMTGVYMLDPMEQNLLHFFMLLGAFFTLRSHMLSTWQCRTECSVVSWCIF